MASIPNLGDRVKVRYGNQDLTGDVVCLYMGGKEILVAHDVIYPNYGNPLNQATIDSYMKYQDRYKIISNIQSIINRYCYWYIPNDSIVIFSSGVALQPNMAGAHCAKCKEFSPYANVGFTCYACKQDPYRLARLNAEDD